jgi:hypothetical protein
MLLEERRGGSTDNGAVPVRRYRLARLRVAGPPRNPPARLEHLKRRYD